MTTTRRQRRSKPFHVQFVSDLHMEFEDCTADRLRMPIDPATDLVVLAGDIHNEVAGMDSFVRRLAREVPVVMVAGNHEFYGHEFTAQRRALKDWSRTIPDFHLLDNEAVTINGVRIVGSTFWSSFGNGDRRLMDGARRMMTDYSVIGDDEATLGNLKPSRIYREHLASAEFIERELAARDGRRAIVVTHHAPSLRSSRSKGAGFDKLYGSDYERLMQDYDPNLWIHGHVHESLEYRVGKTVVACNPRGYVRYKENEAFVPARSVTVN